MAQLIQILIIIPLLRSVPFWRDNDFHAALEGIRHNVIGIVAAVGQKRPGRYPLYQMDSLFTICSGTLCNKNSDWHTMRIHGQMYFGVEPPFVLAIS